MAIEGLHVDVYDPTDLGSYDWRKVRDMEFTAYSSGGFSPSEARSLLFIGECRGLERYIRSKTNPGSEVKKSLRGGQLISDPRMAIATVGEEIVGSMHVALHNTSGSWPMRMYKRYVDADRDYVVARGIAVARTARMQNVATIMGTKTLEVIAEAENAANRPIAAYVYEQKTPHVAGWLVDHSFERTGEQKVNIAGGELLLARYAAPTVQGVYDSLRG